MERRHSKKERSFVAPFLVAGQRPATRKLRVIHGLASLKERGFSVGELGCAGKARH
jgi:hypothetical protein